MSYTNGLDKPTDYFNTKLYTGNGSTQSITGVGFQPDWVWIKNRPDVRDHQIYDSIRGVTKVIGSDRTSAEATVSNGLTAFGSDGFTVGADSNVNDNGDSHVSWNWLGANGTASNTDGSTTSTVSANTTSGFSIVQWTGTSGNTTIGHGLGTVPAMVIAKNLGGSTNWVVYHKNLTSGYYLKINLTNAQDNANSYFTADPTNSILSLTGSTAFNSSGNGMIAYCFADKQGYSKFGSYTGNGNADGTFVYLGFKPAWVMVKRTDSASAWQINDTKRDPYNKTTHTLFPHLADAESATGWFVDYVSNGFKIRDTGSAVNASGGSYIYMCFAESPFTTSTGIPTTSR